MSEEYSNATMTALQSSHDEHLPLIGAISTTPRKHGAIPTKTNWLSHEALAARHITSATILTTLSDHDGEVILQVRGSYPLILSPRLSKNLKRSPARNLQ